MREFFTRVHIAGQQVGAVQRCSRCWLALIDATGCMTTDPSGAIPFWAEGAFVGIVEARDGKPVNPVCSSILDHDAAAIDEERCSPGGVAIQ